MILCRLPQNVPAGRRVMQMLRKKRQVKILQKMDLLLYTAKVQNRILSRVSVLLAQKVYKSQRIVRNIWPNTQPLTVIWTDSCYTVEGCPGHWVRCFGLLGDLLDWSVQLCEGNYRIDSDKKSNISHWIEKNKTSDMYLKFGWVRIRLVNDGNIYFYLFVCHSYINVPQEVSIAIAGQWY